MLFHWLSLREASCVGRRLALTWLRHLVGWSLHEDAGWRNLCIHWSRRTQVLHLCQNRSGKTLCSQLLDMRKVAPQLWFNLRCVAYLYNNEVIPEVECMTHGLEDGDPNHAAFACKQEVLRRGAAPFTSLLSTFYHRCFEFKYKLQKHGWTRVELWNDCIGTELCLMYLQAAGLINNFW